MIDILLIIIVVAIIAKIYYEFKDKKEKEEQGKIIKREKNFFDEREIFSSKTLEWEEMKKSLDELDLSEIKRLKVTKYDNYYRYSQYIGDYGWVAIFKHNGKTDNTSQYEFYVSSYRELYEPYMINMLFTAIEKMLIELDPDIEVRKEVIKRKTKRSFF